MTRIQIELLLDALDFAYQGDRWSSLLTNLAPITEAEWEIRPAQHDVVVFGTQPELSIGDLVRHIAGPLVMYGNRAFGDGSMTWERIVPPSPDRQSTLGWLDACYRDFRAGVATLPDDTSLDEHRVAHWGEAIPVRRFIAIMTNHLLYHSGEINRQLSLIRGASGWAR